MYILVFAVIRCTWVLVVLANRSSKQILAEPSRILVNGRFMPIRLMFYQRISSLSLIIYLFPIIRLFLAEFILVIVEYYYMTN